MLIKKYSVGIALASILGAHRGPYFSPADPATPPAEVPPKPPGTIESQLATANSELGVARTTINTLTVERDSAVTERNNLQSQFDSLTTESNRIKSELETANGTIGTITAERNTAQGSLTRAQQNITRLESLCNLKGIDPASAVTNTPPPGESDKESRITALQAQLQSAAPDEKHRIVSQIRKIREEA